jgi:histidyl-tRNA synthetase
MNELNLFPEIIGSTTKVLFVNFGPAEEKYCLPRLSELHEAGIPAEIFPDAAKIKKQLDYANRKNIPYVILVGENEMKEGKLTLKDMQTGEQSLLSWKELKDKLLDLKTNPHMGSKF